MESGQGREALDLGYIGPGVINDNLGGRCWEMRIMVKERKFQENY